MKTVQDWGFISKEQGLAKPKLQDNKIFHALTTAYENNQQQEIYGATENIVRREKELCELALADLNRLAGKADPDGTLKLVMEHYSQRLTVAKEKEEKINQLSEDSRKMMEEYKKRTQELADVKRNLMESQSKLRELAKSTEKLIKKEEELRFIETNLRSELDKNKRNIINGLYEIVAEINESTEPRPAAVPGGAPAPAESAASLPQPVPEQEADAEAKAENTWIGKGPERPFTEGLFRKPAETLAGESVPAGFTAAPLFNTAPSIPAPPPARESVAVATLPPAGASLIDKAARLKMFEPGKSLCSKSMVKTPEGEVISEYFYSPLHPKESRQYIFNSLYAVWSLLSLKARDEAGFEDRLETVFGDLQSRLEHGRNIHLESFLKEEINQESLARLMAAPRGERGERFEAFAIRVLNRIESVGPGRAGLIDHQFKHLPRPEFPPREGLKA